MASPSAARLPFNPLLGNSRFGALRGTGYEASLLAGEQALAPSAGATTASTTAPTSWTSVGPQPEQSSATSQTWGGPNSGRITGIAVAPGTSPTIYVATAGGGVWSSVNGGASWMTTTDSQPDLAIGSIAVDPTDPSLVVAGTGEANQCLDCFFGAGIMESTNAGASWTTVNPGGIFTGTTIGSIVIEPGAASLTSTVVLAGTSHGLYISSDGGATWTAEGASSWQGGANAVTSIVLNTLTSAVSIYAYVQNVGLEYSADGGTTWTLIQSEPTGQTGLSDTGTLAIAPNSTTSSTTLYETVGDAQGYVGFYKSTDGGATWSTLSMCADGTLNPESNCVPYFTNQEYAYGGQNGNSGMDQSYYDNALMVDPQNPNIIVAGGITAIESTDGGTTWSNLNGGGYYGVTNNLFHPDFHAFAFDTTGNLYFGNDGGIWQMPAANVNPGSGAPTRAYNNLNSNLNITQFYPGISQASSAAMILAGAQDNGTDLYSSPSTTWSEVLGGDGGGTAIDPNNAQNQLATADGNLYSTTDGWSSTSSEYLVVDDARKLDTCDARKVNSFRHPNSCRRRSASRSAGCRPLAPSVGSWHP